VMVSFVYHSPAPMAVNGKGNMYRRQGA
jgi:hypothetical protein